MILKYKNFLLKRDNSNKDRFDIFETRISKEDINKNYEALIGHSYTFEGALKQIALIDVENATTISEYIIEFKECLKQITKILKT